MTPVSGKPPALTMAQLRAIGLVVGLLALMIVSLGAAFADLMERWDALTVSQATLDQFEARLTGEPRKANGREIKPEEYVIPVASAPLAAADLQRRVSAAFADFGGTVTSTEVLTDEEADHRSAVRLSVSFTIDNLALPNALQVLEGARPALMIDAFTLQPVMQSEGATTPPRVQGSLTLSALWRPVSP